MYDREWEWILNRIKSDKNIIDTIKGKLAGKHLGVYKEWERKKFDINYLFLLRSGYINNACTLLHISARSGLRNIVKALLAIEGININAMDSRYGATPLHVAVENGYEDIIEILLENGAEVNAMDKNAVTPLHLAARSGDITLVETLLKSGAEVNAVDDKYGITSLHGAAEKGHTAVVNFLLENNADVNAVDKNTTTPLHIAAGNGDIEMVHVLLKNKANIDAINRDRATPLHWAARNGHIEVVGALLEKGANASLRDKNSKTPRDLTANDDIKRLFGESEERESYIPAIVDYVVVFTIMIFVLTMWHSELTLEVKFASSIVMFLSATVTILVIDSKYKKPQSNTQVNEIQTVEAHDNQHNSEILMI